MKKARWVLMLVWVACVGFSVSALNIKLGCVAPAGSPWGTALSRLAAKWARITNGQVRLKLFMGGIAGDEPDMIRKMRFGQLQAAAVTMLGLNTVSPDIVLLSIPFMIRNKAEYDHIMGELHSHFEAEIQKKGFRVLVWSFAGWIHLFGKQPVVTPKDLMRLKLGVPVEDTDILHAWRDMGFNAFSVPITDLLLGLQSGMIDALYATPLVAAAFQWFGVANHMSSLKISPVFGAIIISEKSWRRVPAKYRSDLLAAAREAESAIFEGTAALEEEALEIMREHGLVIHGVPDDVQRQWRILMQGGFDEVIERVISPDLLASFKAALDAYRNGSGSAE